MGSAGGCPDTFSYTSILVFSKIEVLSSTHNSGVQQFSLIGLQVSACDLA